MNPEAPWAELVVLAERERDLVREGRWEEIPALAQQRLSASAALGAPPAAARPQAAGRYRPETARVAQSARAGAL